MEESILFTTKKLLGIPDEVKDFDFDVLVNINAAFATLTQIGVGPSDGFVVTDETNTWKEFIENDKLYQDVKQYIFLKTKLVFDSYNSSAAETTAKEFLKEIEYRLRIKSELEEMKNKEESDSV